MEAIAFFVLCLGVLSKGDFLDDFIIHLPNGPLRGEQVKGENGNEFYSFKGIPYAEPPVGNLRFRAPIPKKPWTLPLGGVDDGPLCPQVNPFTLSYQGKEDCLYLNVYTPTLSESAKLNVVYHIHGGAFLSFAGISSMYGPNRFPLKDVVLVSVTYRVGPLGFLSTNDTVSSGNYGLLDQTEGLRWVRNNIHYFGGDPNKVTIFGESAGGASVIYHLLSPLSEGLFHRAIATSGSALCNWALQKDPLYWSKKLANDSGCPSDSSEEIVECLRKIPARELTMKGTTLVRGLFLMTIVPTVDNYFITDHPLNIITKRNYNKDVPLIIGSTKDEGNCLYLGRQDSPDNYTDEEIEDLISGCIDVLPNMEKKIQLVKDKYFANLTSYKEEDVKKRVDMLLTDGLFHKCVFHTAKEMAKSGTETYLYRYDYAAPFSSAQFNRKPPIYGVCHADELFMFFDGIFKASFDKTSTDMKEKLQNLFINFVKFGNPVRSDDNNTCEWPRSKADKLMIYHINQNCSVDRYDETKDPLYKFWINDIKEG